MVYEVGATGAYPERGESISRVRVGESHAGKPREQTHNKSKGKLGRFPNKCRSVVRIRKGQGRKFSVKCFEWGGKEHRPEPYRNKDTGNGG